MADYSSQHGQSYARSQQYGHASPYQRDAAYANIFGTERPPSNQRTQTMSSQTTPSLGDGRSQTMSSQTVNMMQRAPPARQYTNPTSQPITNGHPGQQRSTEAPLMQRRDKYRRSMHYHRFMLRDVLTLFPNASTLDCHSNSTTSLHLLETTSPVPR